MYIYRVFPNRRDGGSPLPPPAKNLLNPPPPPPPPSWVFVYTGHANFDFKQCCF